VRFLEHCESVGEGEGYLNKLPDSMPELSNSFRTKLAQWDDLGISSRNHHHQQQHHVEHRTRKKRGSSSASAVLQRMSLPVVNWVGGTRSPEKTKKSSNFIVEPREIKIDITGHEQKPTDQAMVQQQNIRHSSCISSHRGASSAVVSTLKKSSEKQPAEMNWELQQDVEQAEFRQQRKRRAKKCFPFSICA